MPKPEESKKTVIRSSVEVEKTEVEKSELTEPKSLDPTDTPTGFAAAQDRGQFREPIPVTLTRAGIEPTEDQALWDLIRNRTEAINFNQFQEFMDLVCDATRPRDTRRSASRNPENLARLERQLGELYNPVQGVGAYDVLKTAAQVFLLMQCGVFVESINEFVFDDGRDEANETLRFGRMVRRNELDSLLKQYMGERLPYLQTVINNAFIGFAEEDSIFCGGLLKSRADCPPLMELIWSYWHEEAMLVQSMNAISLRFQNRRSMLDRDPLAHVEIAPLFPINNLLWGYIQDEQQRLSVPRRAYEYNHHYGLTLAGKAIPDFRPAETRSQFLEAFHQLLYVASVFFKQDDDTTVNADAFPVLNALKEVHLILAEGAHNQFGDLPWTSRSEMLVEQWILSRPEMRLFLQSRHMVPYREGWMGQVDTMKRLQGWTDVSVTYFNELAVHGEQLLLSIRYADWSNITNHASAANWAREWRPEIQSYIHNYRAVTGVELRADPTSNQQRRLLTTPPTVLIRERLQNGKSAPALPPPMLGDAAKSFRERQAARRTNGTGR